MLKKEAMHNKTVKIFLTKSGGHNITQYSPLRPHLHYTSKNVRIAGGI